MQCPIEASWSEGETLFFLRGQFSFLKRYRDAVFDGIDGRVLLGITDGNARRIFGEELTERDLGLLLAKLNYFRSEEQPRHAPVDSVRSVRPAESPVKEVVDSHMCEDGVGRKYEATVLVEVWDGENRFMGETWLPEISAISDRELEEHKLQLRRTFTSAEMAKAPLIAPKAFLFGALKIRTRYARNVVISDCKQETGGGILYLTVLECLIYRGAISDSLKFKIHVLPPSLVSDQLRQVYESPTREVLSNSSCVWEEELELRFLGVADWKKKLETTVQSETPVVREELVEPSLGQLRQWAVRDEWYQFHPRYQRYDAWLFPIHEGTAHSGEKHILRSVDETKDLRRSPGFMARFKEAFSLVVLSWGFDMEKGGQPTSSEDGRKWMDHSWRFRHILLSCILLDYSQGVKVLLEIYSALVRRRRINVDENGQGEAIFTLGNEQGVAWFKDRLKSQRGVSGGKWPKRYVSLEELVRIGKQSSLCS